MLAPTPILGLRLADLAPRNRKRLPIEIIPQLNAREVKDRGHDIRMRSHEINNSSSLDPGAADVKGDINIFLEGAGFARLHPVLADVEPVVGRVDDVGVVEQVLFVEVSDDVLDELVDGL